MALEIEIDFDNSDHKDTYHKVSELHFEENGVINIEVRSFKDKEARLNNKSARINVYQYNSSQEKENIFSIEEMNKPDNNIYVIAYSFLKQIELFQSAKDI